MSDAPDTIYLQYVDDDDEFYSETTWCVDRINEDDIPYNRCKTCVWQLVDANWSIWATSCGHTFRFPGGDGPMENMFGWCPYCGGEIQEEQDD